MSGINFRKHFRILSSATLIFTLMFAALGFAIISIVTPARVASAQTGSNMQVSFVYTYVEDNNGDKKTAKFTSSAILSPVTGGFGGNSTGTYEELDVSHGPPCGTSETSFSGSADLVVHAQYSIDNNVTGGPDTTMYNSSTTVIELIFRGDNVSAHAVNVPKEEGCGTQDWTTSEGADCHFYGINFAVGGTYSKPDEDDPEHATCKLTIGSVAEKLRIFGTVKGIIDGQGPAPNGPVPISNSKVVMKNIDDKPFLEPLSQSKPDYDQGTTTSDDKDAKYEFTIPRDDPTKLPKILVVSLLWYNGKPEFAVTNGKNQSGSFIPVYQALCVDDVYNTKCEKWKRSATGEYEAEVNFEYGSLDKREEGVTVVKDEEWDAISIQSMQMDASYIYYNSYRAMKYFDTLGLSYPQLPVMIKSHELSEDACSTDTTSAFYDSTSHPTFGGLGTSLEPVQATGGIVYLCLEESSVEAPDAPMNREWHELGHYLQYEMYNPDDGLPSTSHVGYLNPSSSDSVREGFAEFIGMLVTEYYHENDPTLYHYGTSVADLEQDYKVWGPNYPGFQGPGDEEFAVAGILWDLHDAGVERNPGFRVTNTSSIVQVSKVYANSTDNVTMTASAIIKALQADTARTLVDVYQALGPDTETKDLNMIFLNHGAFADVVTRNYVHDSNKEMISETGNIPDRPVRRNSIPAIPGSYLESDQGGLFNVSFKYQKPFGQYDFSYLVHMDASQRTRFVMPPEYYPSKAIISPVSNNGTQLPPAIEIQSDDYWNYIASGPSKDNVFREISGSSTADRNSVTSLQHIMNIRSLLENISKAYSAGNSTGAEKLAKNAYQDNFVYVEPDLVRQNATELKDTTKKMLQDDLIELIQHGASRESVDAKISEINAKLDQASVVVPEFPAGIAAVMLSILVGSIILFTRCGRDLGFCFK
jgi:hypothetical protein